MTGVLIRREKLGHGAQIHRGDIHGWKTPGEDRSGEWTMQLQIKERPGLPANTRGQERGLDQTLPQSLAEGTKLANSLILDFWLPELWGERINKFLLF